MNRDILNYIIIGVSVLILLTLYFVFAFRPLHQQLLDRKAALQAQQKQLNAAQDMVARYDEFMERVGKLQIEMQQLEERIPSQPRIPKLLKDVTRVAAECNIKDFQFAPQPIVIKEDYALQPIQVTVTCGYHSLGLFVSKLAALPRLVNTRDFQIVGQDKTGATASISVKMTLVTYVRRSQ